MSVELKCLKALHGDAFIITVKGQGACHHIVVDGGPNSKFCIDGIVEEFNKLPVIDLLVLTHFDDDHIAGIIEYLKRHETGAFPVKRVWANCSADVRVVTSSDISYGQAKTLESLMLSIKKKQDFVKEDSIINTIPIIDLDFCQIQVLSPSPEALRINVEEYAQKIATIASQRIKDDSIQPLEDLAARVCVPSKDGDDVINRSSIAFVLRADGKSVLMMGDADPWMVLDKLKELGYSEESPLHLDCMKVSHHGSRNNICNELLAILDCNNYVISTNGGYGRSNHPDRETLAKLLCNPRRDRDDGVIQLFFNYSLRTIEKRTGKLLTDEELKQHRCVIHEDVETIVI